jgi:hypothetical protein
LVGMDTGNRTLREQSIVKVLVMVRQRQRLIRNRLALEECVTLCFRLVTDLSDKSAWSMVQTTHLPPGNPAQICLDKMLHPSREVYIEPRNALV